MSTSAPVHARACWAGNGDRESVKISRVSDASGPVQDPQPTSSWFPKAVSSSGAVSPAALATASGGGFGAGVRGTIKMVALGTVVSVPIGVLAAVYLSEYKPRGPLATTVRFISEVMTGIPSIFVGIFVFTVVVLETHTFSSWAGGLALGILMLPVIVRTSEEALQLVRRDLREASLALGVRRWRTVVSVILPTAAAGITTGALLAVARAAGETAPLLLTSFGNQLLVGWGSWNGPESALTLEIFTDSRSPFPAQQARAWTGALVLIAGILIVSLVARAVIARRSRLPD